MSKYQIRQMKRKELDIAVDWAEQVGLEPFEPITDYSKCITTEAE